MTIILLGDELINKIAAGEVIERPSSIVKELIENSIDAKSSAILIRIFNGGIDEIQVEDDGQGIEYDELPLAFLRHATSKLTREEDLYAIHTMGFRGEALPSIAAVSRIEMYTKTPDEVGSRCIAEGGVISKRERFPTAEGTKIIIRDLFYNTPVRKTFLKSPVSEGNSVYEMVCKYALAYPEISFVFDNHKKTQFKTPGNGILRDTVFSIYGSDINNYLLEINEQGSGYSLRGLISKPEFKRNNRRQGFFFVNRRPIRSPILTRAVDIAYRGLLVSREYPVFFLSLEVMPDSVDVNIHPQKSEVRFQDEQTVIRFVSGVIKKYLDTTDFRIGNHFQSHQFPAENFAEREWKVGPQQLFSDNRMEFPNSGTAAISEAQYSFLAINTEKATSGSSGDIRIIGQLQDSYILAENGKGLLIIDQHAAHERICYNKIVRDYKASSFKENLVFPLPMDLSHRQTELLTGHMSILQELGFEIDIIGHNSIVIRAVPVLAKGNELTVIISIVDKLQEGDSVTLKEDIMIKMACEKAVTAGAKLNQLEMFKIVNELLAEENYKNCPHGRPTIININDRDLQRMFKR